MSTTVFYAWQSDRPGNTTRSFIQQALEDATKAIRNDLSIDIDPRLDKDTADVPGSPDIVTTIFEKIDRAAVFVADVTLVTADVAGRPSPNPNVLVEIGYALKVLGSERMVLVMNDAYGSPSDLPFDIRQRRTMTFTVREADSQKAEIRRGLQQKLERAVRAALVVAEQSRPASPPTRQPADVLIEALGQGRADRRAVTRRYAERTLDQLDQLCPVTENDDELLVSAINASVPVVDEFARVAEQTSIYDDPSVREELTALFEQLLCRFDNPKGFAGSFFRTKFDFFKFVTHEMFVIWTAALWRERRLDTLKEVLSTPLTVVGSTRQDRINSFASLSSYTALLDDARRERLKTNRTSIRADILKERYTSGALAARVVWQEFMDADYLLYLRSQICASKDWEDAWRPWSVLYMSGAPEFIERATGKKFARELGGVLGVADDSLLGAHIRKADDELNQFYNVRTGYASPCKFFKWERIATV